MGSSIQNVSAEELAKLFHLYHEALSHGSEPNQEIGKAWERTPHDERRLMVAAARLTLLDLSSGDGEKSQEREYYAPHGSADWGC